MIYLDHAATSPLDPRVLEAMLPHLQHTWGNPSSPHKKGRDARNAIDGARTHIAELLGVLPHEVIFTASGSEGNTLALFGMAEEWMRTHQKPGHLIALSIEHECSIKAIERLEEKGWAVTLLPVDEYGMLRIADLKSALREDTALVSIQWANNEVGTIHPIEDVHALCKEKGIVFHCDAVQPIGQLPLPSVIPDLMTIAAHKFHGPKGIGALIVRDHVKLQPVIMGGGQEFGLRAGTENTPGIIGMAAALELAHANLEKNASHMRSLNEYFVQALCALPGVSLNGHPAERLPNNVSLHFEHHAGDTLVIHLDMHGICVSSGAACATGAKEVSHVLKAMGRNDREASENIRFSLGKDTTKEELETVIGVIKKLIQGKGVGGKG